MAHKLLLADDSVTIQRVIELTFADEDIEVVAVGDGQQAIDRIGADPPDVVLADVGMPERDGYEVASFVKQTPRLAHIPVLLLTGAFEPVDEARARAAGCDGVLVKPFEPQMVINRVKDLLAGRRSDAMWATPPAQPTEAAPSPAAPAAETKPAANAAPGSDSLDDYFDRLDAAFSGLGAEPAAAAEPTGETRPAGQAAPADPLPASAFDTLEPEPPAGTAAQTSDDGLGGWDPGLSADEPTPTRAAAPLPPPPPAPATEVNLPPPEGGWLDEARQPVPSLRPAEQQAPALTPPPPAAPQAPESAPATLPSLSDAFGALLAAEQEQPRPAAAARAPVTDETIELVVQKVVERLTTAAVRETVTDVAERLVREEIARIKSGGH